MNFAELAEMVVRGDHRGAAAWTETALADGVDPVAVISEGLVVGMDEIGRRWKANEIFLPEVLVAARAMKAGMALVRPQLAGSGNATRGKVVIGTVQGDIHDIGKNFVVMMPEGAGFEVCDLGTDIAPDVFVKAVQEQRPDVLGMSALLSTTVPMMQRTVEVLSGSGLRDTVRVVVGGAPINAVIAEQMGADGYAADGATAVDVVAELVVSA